MRILKKAGQKMRYILQKIFRYRLSSLFMLVSYILSFVVIFNGISIYLSAQDAQSATEQYQYSYQTELEMTDAIDLDSFIKASEAVPCIVSLNDVLMFSDEEYTARCVQVVLHDTESAHPLGCVIGDALEPYAVCREGKQYFSLEGDLYEISEVIDGKDSDFSYLVRIPYAMLKESAKRVTGERLALASVLLQSNEIDTQEAKKSLEAGLSATVGSKVVLHNISLGQSGQQMPEASALGIYLCIFSYFFCMVNCVIVCEFWIFQRRKEIAVRRAYHFDDKRICNMLFFDMLRIIAAACALYLLLHVSVLSRLMEFFSVEMTLDFRSILFMLFMIPVSATVTILPYMRKLKKGSYAAGIREV